MYGDLNPRDNRNQVMCRWSRQITSDYADCPLNPSRLVSPPHPPSAPPPFLIVCPYHRPLVTQHMVYRGVSKQLPLTEIIGILILQLTLFALLFLHCFFPVHFSQYPLPKKCTLFFLPVINPKSFLPLFPLLQFFTPLNELCQLLISKELKPPC